MKVLYVGPYKDGTGWSEAATRTILALDSAGADVVPRQYSYNKRNEYLHPRIKELEDKTTNGCDVVIQNVLPHNMEYVDGLFNVGYFMSETDTVKMSSWEHNLQTMDAVMFPNQFSKYACKHKSQIEFDIPARDISEYTKTYPSIIEPGDNYTFYFIGEFSSRKNLAALLIAFHAEFDPHEPVEIVVKTSVPNKSAKDGKEFIQGLCEHIKKQLKLYKDIRYYKPETVITEHLPNDVLMGLHQSCDCFCMLSHGEALCLPALDAHCFGNAMVVSDSDELSREWGNNIHLVNGQMSPCTGALDTFDFLYTGHDEWFMPNIKDIQKAMRLAYMAGKKKRNPEVPYYRKQAYSGKLLIKEIEKCLSYSSQ